MGLQSWLGLKKPKPPDIPAFAAHYFGMLSDDDRRMYYEAAKGCSLEGAIVDLGTFVGATTACLALGVLNNRRFSGEAVNRTRIHAYDLFQCDHIGAPMMNKFIGDRIYAEGDDILPIFKERLRPLLSLVDIHAGDIRQEKWTSEQPIEILGVDLCKHISITDYVIREFFTRLQPGSLVLHQDYMTGWLPHIHISMGYFRECFDIMEEAPNAYTVSFRMKKPISSSEAAAFSEILLHSKSDWLPLFDRARRKLRTKNARHRVLPARAMLVTQVHGIKEGTEYAAEIRPKLDAPIAAELDQIMALHGAKLT